jgi:hypothetical protein
MAYRIVGPLKRGYDGICIERLFQTVTREEQLIDLINEVDSWYFKQRRVECCTSNDERVVD